MFAKERENRSGLKDCGMVKLSKRMKRGQKNQIGSRQRLNITLGVIQKIRVQMGGRGGGYCKMTQNVTVGGGGYWSLTRVKY
jgi:hypothetical protein